MAEILENRHVHDLPKRPGRPNTLLEIEDGLFREQPFFGGGQVGVLPEAPRVHLFWGGGTLFRSTSNVPWHNDTLTH